MQLVNESRVTVEIDHLGRSERLLWPDCYLGLDNDDIGNFVRPCEGMNRPWSHSCDAPAYAYTSKFPDNQFDEKAIVTKARTFLDSYGELLRCH
jgi:hypothetical protein